MRDVGGTRGGLGAFLLGCGMIVAAGYWLLNQVIVYSHPWRVFGYDAFGLSLVPLVLGIGLLFFDGRSPAGWLLTAAGVVVILAGVVSSMDIFFRPASLFSTLLILGLLAAGLGLVARSMRSL